MTFSKHTISNKNILNALSSRDVSQEILRAVDELKNGSGFGSIEIVLHEGRVTQIEKREKLRFTQDNITANSTAPAGAK